MKEKISLKTLKNFLLPKEMKNIMGGSNLCTMICGNVEVMMPHGTYDDCVDAAYSYCMNASNGYSCPGCN